MSIKKKLGTGVATAVLGLALIGGGTFAYFSDTAEATAEFTAGELSLSANPSVVVEVADLKPGDWIPREFELINDGTLDISKVDIHTDYTVVDVGENNGEDDFGKHIKVKFLRNMDKNPFEPIGDQNIITETTLYDLKNQTPDAVEKLERFWNEFIGEDSGLEAGDSDTLRVAFEFEDNGEDQNHFQQDSLSLEWTFEAHQTEGEAR